MCHEMLTQRTFFALIAITCKGCAESALCDACRASSDVIHLHMPHVTLLVSCLQRMRGAVICSCASPAISSCSKITCLCLGTPSQSQDLEASSLKFTSTTWKISYPNS